MHTYIKKTYFIICFLLMLTFHSSSTFAQKKVLTDEDVVAETVTKEIDAVFNSKEFTKKKGKKFAEVNGTITVDVGIVQNGKVSSFFKVDSDINNPNFINFISEYILDHKFQFKLQKQQRYKVRYSAIFK